MKKFTSMILAVVIGILGSFALFGCNKKAGGGETDDRYYRYNAEADVFDKTEYLEIDGNTCSLVKNTDGITVTAAGTVSFSGDTFTVTCASELLGIPITTVMRGERESGDVLRVDSQTVIGLTSTPATDTEVIYYCHDGIKPSSPVKSYTITFDANGGNFDGNKSTVTAKTNGDGTVALPTAPTRDGYDFDGYYASRTGGTTPISSSTLFDHSMTVYALWTKRTENANRYYAYDPKTQQFDLNDYMEFDGTKFLSVAVSGSTTYRFDGTVAFSGNSFQINTTKNVMGMTATIVMRGERESNGVLRFDSMTITIDGYQDVDETVFYYCPNGVKPLDPVVEVKTYEITFDASPGKFSDNTQTKTVTTDENGKVVLPEAPTRNGYRFKGFTHVLYDGYITADTVFTYNTTVKAEFVQLHTVTFKVGGTTTETRVVEHDNVLGSYVTPSTSGTNYHMFKGWKEKGGYRYYTPSTKITKDVTLEAEFYTHDEAAYFQSCLDWQKPGHLYIHYLRKDAQPYQYDRAVNKDNLYLYGEEYVDWLLWAWPGGNAPGRAFEPIRIGMYGVVYDIDMKATYTDGGWDDLTKTHKGEQVSFYNKTIGLMFFNDKSRMNGDGFWENDGGDLILDRHLVFDYWDVDNEGNQIGPAKYLFDSNVSARMLFLPDYTNQETINNYGTPMFVTYHYNQNA